MKVKYPRHLITVFSLILCLLLGGLGNFPLTLQAGEDGELPVSQEFINTLTELEKKFDNPTRESHPLDKYKLLDQIVHNSDQERIDQQINEVLTAEGDEEIVDDFVDRDLKTRRYYQRNLQIEVRRVFWEDNEAIATRVDEVIKEKDFLFADLKEKNAELFQATPGNRYRFNITDKKGEVLHTFYGPIQSVGFFGPYLVYTKENSYNERTGQLELNFINLEYFRGDIGNSNLPVFTLPVKTGEALKSLTIKKGVLYVNDTPIQKRAIDFLSEFYQVLFNISVSMVNPETYSRSENLIKEIVYFFNQSLNAQETTIRKNLEQALGNEEELQKILADSVASLENQSSSSSTLNGFDEIPEEKELKELDESVQRTIKFARDAKNIDEQLAMANNNIQSSRKFLSRVHMWMANLSTPQPFGPRQLIGAMATLANSTFTKDTELQNAARHTIENNKLYKYLKWGGFAVAAAAIGPLLPEPYTFHIYQSLDLAKTLFADTVGYLEHSNYGLAYPQLLGEAIKTGLSGIPSMYEAYFVPDKLPKFVMGITTVISIPFMVFGIPHTLVNSIKALKSINGNWSRLRGEGLGRLATFKQGFIEHMQEERTKYDLLLAEAEKEISGGNIDLTDDELAELNEILAKLKSSDKKKYLENLNEGQSNYSMMLNEVEQMIKDGRLELSPEELAEFEQELALDRASQGKLKIGSRKILNMIKDALKAPFVYGKWARIKTAETFYLAGAMIDFNTTKLKLAGSVMYKVGKVIDVPAKTEAAKIDSFAKAFQNFFFSYPTITNTYKFLATTWNYCFLSRSFALKPNTWAMGLIYPRYFRVTIQGENNRINFPSQFNGGTRTFFKHWSMRSREWFGNADLLALREWEKSVLPIESIVYELSLQKSLEALIKEIDDPERLKVFFDSTVPNPNAIPTTGIGSLGDIKMSKLNGKERAFFRAYFTKLYDETMAKYISEMNLQKMQERGHQVSSTYDDLTVEQLKRLSLFWLDDLKKFGKEMKESAELKAGITEEIKVTMQDVIASNGVLDFSRKVSAELGMFFKRKELNFRHNLFKTIQPRNPQIKRFLTAEEYLNKPKSLLRAVRSEVASLLVNKPLQLLGILALYAGVDEGVLRPLHDTMNGPDSWMYMSRYLFYNGFVMGTVISIMADTWMKVQTDARIQSLGNFDKVPLKKYRERGFWRYYAKSLVNPTNKWVANQLHYSQLVWANIPAAFITISVTNFLMLGRFDLGSFIAGYMIVFLTPLMGMNLKFEQAFELASSWVAARIPRKYRSHPNAQNWINFEIQKKKLVFNIFYQLWETVSNNIMGIYELMSTDMYGKRSLLRLVFGGYTPTELAALGLRKVGDAFGFIPGFELVTSKCEDLLTNNYTDWQKVAPRGK